MRHSNRWLRGKLGGCHLLMLLLKVVFFFFFSFLFIIFSPGFAKHRHQSGSGDEAAALCPVAGLGQAGMEGTEGTVVPQGLLAVKSRWVLPVVVL